MDEIGEKLREARIKKGYTLDDLQKITKIQKRYLIAIEEGNFDALPGDFYVRAFIKEYADSVGLNGDKLLNEYKKFLPLTNNTDNLVKNKPVDLSRENKNKHYSWWSKYNHYVPQITIITLVIIVIIFIWIAAIHHSHEEQQSIAQPSSIAINSSSSFKKKSSSSSSSSSSKNISIQQSSLNGNVQSFVITNAPLNNNKLSIKVIKSKAWTSVSIAGRNIYEGVITPSNPQIIKIPNDAKQIVIRSGNAPQTQVSFNSQNIDINKNVNSTVRTIVLNNK